MHDFEDELNNGKKLSKKDLSMIGLDCTEEKNYLESYKQATPKSVPNDLSINKRSSIIYTGTSGGSTTVYRHDVMDFSEPTLESVKAKMIELEKEMSYLRKQMTVLGEGEKKNKKRKLGKTRE